MLLPGKNNRTSLLFILVLLLTSRLSASVEFNDQCKEAMRLAFDLKMNSARELLCRQKQLHPENAAVDFLEHYIDALELIVTEDRKVFDRMTQHYEERLDRLKAEPSSSPLACQLQAELVFHQGLAQIRYGNRLAAISKIVSAQKTMESNLRKFPSHKENLKLAGIFNLVADNIPPFMKWTARMLGIKGNTSTGMEQLQAYAGYVCQQPGLREESIILVQLAFKLLGDENKGLRFTQARMCQEGEAAMVRYFQASLASFSYRNDLALDLLDKIRRDELQVRFWGLDYLYGRCLMNRMDEKSGQVLEEFYTNYPGEDFRKDVSHRLAFFNLLNGNQAGYEKWRNRTLVAGVQDRDRDREAMIESQSEALPHTGLLKARLWFDGGYFRKADSILRAIDPSQLKQLDRLEYHYRLGRLSQETGDTLLAIQELMWTVNYGQGTPNTWSARAALNLARIYESSGEISRAAQWYDKCLRLYDPAHTVESVEQMAKNGEWRMENGE